MTIQECIKKTIEYLDGVYKDGPHFHLKNDTPDRQMEELISVYKSHLGQNLNTLRLAYNRGIKDDVTFNEYGWLKLPEIPEDRIETLRATSGKTEVSIKLTEANGRWLCTFKICGSIGGYNNGTLKYYFPDYSTREDAIKGAIKGAIFCIEDIIGPRKKDKKSKELCNQVRRCIEEIQENEIQGKLF